MLYLPCLQVMEEYTVVFTVTDAPMGGIDRVSGLPTPTSSPGGGLIGPPSPPITQSLLLLVGDVNDNQPVFRPYSPTVELWEDADIGTPVGTFRADDADEGPYGQVGLGFYSQKKFCFSFDWWDSQKNIENFSLNIFKDQYYLHCNIQRHAV